MKRKASTFLLVLAALLFMATVACTTQPKYVFFFLGDGMGNSQIQATEAYLTTLNGSKATLAEDLLKPENRLNMTKMPVLGMQTTYDASSLITDSASAGTALACGIKTVSGTIGMDASHAVSYKSIAQLAHERGKKVGIITSVSLDHATPASYYASIDHRGNRNNIATQMANSGYEFFGGGGLGSAAGPARSGDTNNDVWALLAAKGYTIVNDRASILALKEKPKSKVVCINPWLPDAAAMPYEIDRKVREDENPTNPNRNLSLAEMTDIGIHSLYGSKRGKGFFLMVEGGKIDWACHANDAMTAICEMLDFDRAIGVALEFYQRYPQETLIVVTSDHETGGMSIGHATTHHTASYERLLGQKNSATYFAQNQWPAHKAAQSATVCPSWQLPNNLETDTAMTGLMASVFGLNWKELDGYQQARLEDAYDKSMCGVNANLPAENTLLYGSNEPIAATITRIQNERAGIGWISYAHTGVPVPVFARGRDANRFTGFYENTDLAKRLAKAMGIGQNLPVAK